MDINDPAEPGTSGNRTPAVVVLTLCALIVACASWAVIGYFIASTLSLGLILLPVGSGCGAGVLMLKASRFTENRLGLVAVAVTLLGCIIGDFIWIMLATQKPVGLLLGAEIVATLNTLFHLQKAIMYAIACYLAFTLTNLPVKRASG